MLVVHAPLPKVDASIFKLIFEFVVNYCLRLGFVDFPVNFGCKKV